MRMKKIIASLLIIAIISSLIPTHIFAVSPVRFTITPSVTEAHPGDVITYTVKMSAVQNLASIKFKLDIPSGLTYIDGAEVEGLKTKLNAALAKFTEETKIFIVGSSDYSSDTDTVLMTFRCSVDSGVTGDKEIKFIIDEEDIFDTSEAMNNIPVEYSDPGSKVKITIPSTGISLNKNMLSLEKGTNETLIATVTPENSTDTVIWKSSDESKATVDSTGKVSAIAEGTVNITAETTSGRTATCIVTITKAVCKHLNKTTVPAKAATCTVPGNNEYKTCDNCGKAFKTNGTTETTIEAEKINALGHDFSVPQTNATQHWNECSRCGSADTKINHIGEGEYGKDSTKHWKVCGCGTKVEEEVHTPATAVRENEHAATCTTDGGHDEVVYCSVCEYKISTTPKIDKATGHTEGTPVRENEVPATCTEEGSYNEVVYCSVCNVKVSSTSKTVPATGHTEGTPVNENIVPATCTKKGTYNEVVYCTTCNAKIKSTPKETEMIPHDVSSADWSNDETNHWKECGCGTKVDIAAHIEGTPVNENIVPATCTTDGSHEEVVYCSVCNREMSRIPKIDKATGHTEGKKANENIVPATCTTDGSHEEVVYCSVCDCEISRTPKVDKATGHTEGTPVKENEVPATCIEEGTYNEVVYCTKCNTKMSTKAKTLPAKGHTEGAIVIENKVESTVEKEGSYDEVIYCIDCDEELSRTKKITPKFVYEILDGANSTHQDKDSKELTIRANGKFDKFEGIKVDGKIVDKSNYTAKEGSTIVTLKAAFLNTLTIGDHKITFLYDDGEVETTFKIAEKKEIVNKPTTPMTGDTSNIELWEVGLAVSGILFVIVAGCKIKGSIKKGRH